LAGSLGCTEGLAEAEAEAEAGADADALAEAEAPVGLSDGAADSAVGDPVLKVTACATPGAVIVTFSVAVVSLKMLTCSGAVAPAL
jgi:hypothetical protein